MFASLIASCSVNQKLMVRSDGSGSVSMRIELKEVFIDYLLALASIAGDSAGFREGKLFDLSEIRKSIEERPGVVVTRIETPVPEVLEVDFTFRNVDDIFATETDLQEAGIISFTRAGTAKSLRLYLDKRNYQQLSELFPILANPVFESLGPQEDDTTSEQEYLEIIAFALGDDGPPAIKESNIVVDVQTDGAIVSQKGGSETETGAVFSIPLIRVLLLDQPLDYSLSYQ